MNGSSGEDSVLEMQGVAGFPGGSDGKESACSAGNPGSVPGSGRSSGEGNGNDWRIPWTEEPGRLQFVE